MSRGQTAYTDDELRSNHEFVTAFETLRKRFGFREMSDASLQQIAEVTGTKFETLRVARHLRNALAHDEAVNRDTLLRYRQILIELTGESPAPREQASTVVPASLIRAWRVHAWQDPRLEQEMIANGFVSIGGEEIGDLTGVTDPEVIRAWLTESLPDRTPNAIRQPRTHRRAQTDRPQATLTLSAPLRRASRA